MNNPSPNQPSPLVPQGSNLEQKNLGRARVRFAVFFIIAFHVVGLMALLLMPGCRKAAEPEAAADPNAIVAPALDPTNAAIEPEPVPGMSNTVALNAVQPAPELPPLPAIEVKEYVIVKGDTYSTIAKHFGVSVKALTEANPGVDPTRLQIGKKIVIPAPAAASTTTTMTPTAPAAGGQTIHKVKSGDNLTKIAEQYHTTIKAIRAENNLTSDRIIVGQELKIPAASAPAPATP